MFGEEHKLWNTLSCSFLHPSVTSPQLGLGIPLSTLFSDVLSLYKKRLNLCIMRSQLFFNFVPEIQFVCLARYGSKLNTGTQNFVDVLKRQPRTLNFVYLA
jgi:hypothetical protein